MKARKEILWPKGLVRATMAVFAASVAFYALGMARGFATDDSAELQIAGPAMQQLHATGYPLQLLLIRAATALSPLDDATTVTLLSPLAAGAALAFLFAAIAIVTGSRYNGICAVLVFGTSHTFWMQASLPEVYALHSAFLAALLLLYSVALRRPGLAPRCALASAFLLGVGAGNHLTLILMPAVFGPAYWLAFRRTRRPLCIFTSAAVWAVALLSIQAVLVIRFRQLAEAGLLGYDPQSTTPEGFAIWWALGGPARTEMFAFSAGELARRAAQIAAYFLYQFPSPVLLLMAAAPVLVWRQRRTRAWMFAAIGVGAVAIVHGMNFNSSDIYVFYIPLYLAAASVAGLIFDDIAPKLEGLLPGNPRYSLPSFCIFIPILLYLLVPRLLDEQRLTLSWDKGNTYYLWPPKSGSFQMWNDQAEAIIATVPPGAPILTDWNYFYLLNGFAQRLPPEKRPLLVNMSRQGSPLTHHNWSSYLRDYLVANPAGRVYVTGQLPLTRFDPVFMTHTLRTSESRTACFQIVEFSTKPTVGDRDFELTEYIFNLLRIRLERRSIGPEKPNSMRVRPFYNGRGMVESAQYEGAAIEEYMRVTGRDFGPKAAEFTNLPKAPTPPPAASWDPAVEVMDHPTTRSAERVLILP